MIANHWVDPYTLLMGVHMMDVVVEALCISGLVYAPFFVAIVQSIVEAMTQGDDEGNAGELAVKFLRKRLLGIFTVFILAFIPVVDVTSNIATRPANSCVDPGAPNPTNSVISMVGNFNSSSTKAPMFWAAVHDFSSITTNVVISTTPCAEDIAAINSNVNSANFTNPQDRELAQQWGKSCLAPASGKVSQGSKFDGTWWIGHPDFIAQYKKEGSVVLVNSEVASGLGLAGDNSGGQTILGCNQAFVHLMGSSLQRLNQTEGFPVMLKQMAEKHNLSEQEIAYRLAGEMIGSTKRAIGDAFQLPGGKIVVEDSMGTRTNNEDSEVAQMIAAFTTSVANAVNAPDAIVFRQSIPIQMAVVQMILLMVIPIILVFRGFDIKVTLLLAGLYFGVEFTTAIVSLATWVGSLVDVIFATVSTNGTYARAAALQLYTYLPLVWFFILGLVGIQVVMPGIGSHGADFGGTSGNVGKLASMAKGGAGLATKVGASFMK